MVATAVAAAMVAAGAADVTRPSGNLADESERLLIREYALQNPDRNGGGRIIALTSDHAVHNLPFGASKGALDRIVIAAARDSQITRSPPT